MKFLLKFHFFYKFVSLFKLNKNKKYKIQPTMISKEQLLEKLGVVRIPDSNLSVADIVTKFEITEKSVVLQMELVKQQAALKNSLERVANDIIKENTPEGTKIDVKIDTKIELQSVKVNTDQPLDKVKNIIAVASGKGGVGKSTVSANLAVALATTGAKVGLLDADVYGPSIPKMFGTEGEKPLVKKVNNKDLIVPIEKYGVKMLSIGFFVKPEDALIWRGSMATSALKQLLNDSEWGELDYLILDLPPGTGDIHLTMVQTVPVTGAVIVTTPQDMALADAVKAVSMFKANKIEVPVLGFVENMSWFTPEELPDNKYYIFGKGGGEKIAKQNNKPLLGQIPIVQSIRENGDNGKPSVLENSSISAKAFLATAGNLIKSIEERNTNEAPTKVVEMNK